MPAAYVHFKSLAATDIGPYCGRRPWSEYTGDPFSVTCPHCIEKMIKELRTALRGRK